MALLDGVSQLVREQVHAGFGIGRELPRSKPDLCAHRIRSRVDCGGGGLGGSVGVDAHRFEADPSEAGFKLCL